LIFFVNAGRGRIAVARRVLPGADCCKPIASFERQAARAFEKIYIQFAAGSISGADACIAIGGAPDVNRIEFSATLDVIEQPARVLQRCCATAARNRFWGASRPLPALTNTAANGLFLPHQCGVNATLWCLKG
jgi:hypothetical protein